MRSFCLFLLLIILTGAVPAAAQLYQVRAGQLPYAGRSQASLNVVVDGSLDQTRDFWQSYMKDTYRVSFRGGFGGLLGLNKQNVLTAKQVVIATLSSRPTDLYAAFTPLADSTTEVAFFGSYNGKGDQPFFSPDLTAQEFGRMQAILEKYAPAARLNALRQRVAEAEANVAAIEKQKEKLERSMESTRNSTANNLKRIEDLKRQNEANRQQLRQDSTQLVGNGVLRETSRQALQRRRERLGAVGK